MNSASSASAWRKRAFGGHLFFGGGGLAPLGGFEFLDGDGLFREEFLDPPQFAGGEA